MRYVPHVTLMHPRTTDPAAREAAWPRLRSLSFDGRVEIAAVTLIRSGRHDAWAAVDSVELT